MKRPKFLTLATKSKEIFFNDWPQYLTMKGRADRIEKMLESSRLGPWEKTELRIELNKIKNWLTDNENLRP